MISTSAQRRPGGPPRALATASLAAKQAASEAGGAARSPSVNSRAARAGVRRSARSRRATSTRSTPMPTITPPACHAVAERPGRTAPVPPGTDSAGPPLRSRQRRLPPPSAQAHFDARDSQRPWRHEWIFRARATSRNACQPFTRSLWRRGITRRPAGFRGYAGAGFGGPHSGPRPTVLLKRADRGGQAAREPLGVLVVGRLDPDPHRWLGAARPPPYPAPRAQPPLR